MADRDSQRYYWLKLDKDFFNEYKIRSLMSMKKGDTYICVLLQLMNECLNYDGVLRYSKNRAYTTTELACVIGRSPKVLEEALTILEQMELIEIDKDGTIRMDVNVGSETYQTKRKRDLVKSTEDLPKNYQEKSVKSTLDIRYKSLENRKEEDLIKEKTARMLEMGYSSNLVDKALTMLYRDGCPHTAEFYQTILNTLTDDSIYNKDGYIYECILNERNKA